MKPKQAWLVKSEPSDYSFEQLLAEGRVVWDGIRNYEARKYLSQMRVGDPVLFYHASPEKAIVGLAVVSRAAFPDPKDFRWLAVELSPQRPFRNPLSLAYLKAHYSTLPLIRRPRLSVMPIDATTFEQLCQEGT